MTLYPGDDAPDFTADTTRGTLNFYDWLGDSWGVLFSHPGDFTPVCTTELGTVARLKGEFDKRNTKVMGLSVDSIESHEKWECDIGETQGTDVNFPMIADTDHKVSVLYEMINPNTSATSTIRSVFVIDPDKKIRLNLAYPMTTGRSFPEILRAIDSLQLTGAQPVATPADWQPGQDVIISLAVSDTDAELKFPGYRTVKPYLRLTPDPHPVSAEMKPTMTIALSTRLTDTDFDTAVTKTKEALALQGFGVLTEIDMQATVKAKLGVDMEQYLILGACNPTLAHTAVGIMPQIGLLLPCNVLVRADNTAPGTVIVEAMNPAIMVDVTGEPAMSGVAHEATTKLQAVFDSFGVEVASKA